MRDLTKRFGSFTAVDNLSFTVEPGRITGFLGPNGAGKTTTLRMLLGLVKPTSGTATIGGRRYHDIEQPMGMVGSALEATNFHPGRTGRDHLRVLADTAGVSDKRVDEMLELVGIPAAARKRAGGYSMGMRQRLGLAAAMLGDPQVLILDEPANGLDPEGIRWLRGFLRHLAGQGKTILISSHMLQEVEQTVDDVVIITNGKLVRQGAMTDLHGAPRALVRTSDAAALAGALRVSDITSTDITSTDVTSTADGTGALVADTRTCASSVTWHSGRACRSTSSTAYRTTSSSCSSRSPRTPTATSASPRRPSATPSRHRKGRTGDRRHQGRVPQVLHHPPVVGHGHRDLRGRRPLRAAVRLPAHG